jgi:hypothetical protein
MVTSKRVQSPEPDQSSRPQPYHRFVDRLRPDDYRLEEIKALKKAIRAKENRLVLGMPDIGLSNLFRFLVTMADWGDRKVTMAYLDCDALDDCLDNELFFGEIARQFYEQNLGNMPGEDTPGYEQLKTYVVGVSRHPLDRLVVVVNKTDRLLAAANRAFYRQLKALTDLNKCVCYIFAANSDLSNIVDPEDLLFAGRKLFVGRLNHRDLARAIVEEGQRLEKEFDPTEQQQLAHLTGGHPGLLRAVSSAAVEERLNLSNLEAELVDGLLARADVNIRCQRIWQALDSAQRATLHTIVSGQPGQVTQDTLAHLRNFDLVEENNTEYRLFSPIFAGFVATQQIEAKLVYLVAGKVFRGDKEITLRPLEHKLLTVLMAEPGRVYTHDEIAWRVWDSDEVTPDMINGLVYQLRSRLGKRYIKTHHGRGYEFITG